jgi:enoyl-CoA hydratase/carnithine racemase
MRDGAAATLTLVPPEGKPPTLDHAVFASLDAALDELEADLPRVVILRSASARYFCVGANINVLQEMNARTIGSWITRGHRAINRLEDLACPVVARVEGYALGGGLELALGCDLLFAGPDAKLGLTEARLGFLPGWGGSLRFPQRVGASVAKRYFFTGGMMDAQTARQAGLVDVVGSASELDTAIAEFVAAVENCSACAIGHFKKIVNDQYRAAREQNLAAEVSLVHDCLQDPGTQGRLRAFLEKKK